MIFQEESADKDTEPSYLCDLGLDDEIIGIALSSPLFIQEREEPADRRQAYQVCCQFSHFSHTQERGHPCTNLFAKFVQRKTKSRNGKRNNQDSL